MTSCAFKIHRASGPAQGKPVLISIIGFFARVSRRSSRTQQFQRKSHITIVRGAIDGSSSERSWNKQTDRHTHTTTTVILAEHARAHIVLVHTARAQENNTHWQINTSRNCVTVTRDYFRKFIPPNAITYIYLAPRWLGQYDNYAIALVAQQTQGFPSTPPPAGTRFRHIHYKCLLDVAALQTAGKCLHKAV